MSSRTCWHEIYESVADAAEAVDRYTLEAVGKFFAESVKTPDQLRIVGKDISNGFFLIVVDQSFTFI